MTGIVESMEKAQYLFIFCEVHFAIIFSISCMFSHPCLDEIVILVKHSTLKLSYIAKTLKNFVKIWK